MLQIQFVGYEVFNDGGNDAKRMEGEFNLELVSGMERGRVKLRMFICSLV